MFILLTTNAKRLEFRRWGYSNEAYISPQIDFWRRKTERRQGEEIWGCSLEKEKSISCLEEYREQTGSFLASCLEHRGELPGGSVRGLVGQPGGGPHENKFREMVKESEVLICIPTPSSVLPKHEYNVESCQG